MFKRKAFEKRKTSTKNIDSQAQRKTVKLSRFDDLSINSIYEISGPVKIYGENVLEKEPNQLMAYVLSAKKFKGRFKVLDIDGGIGEVPLWYQVELIRIVSDSNIGSGYIGWVNSLSLKSVKTRRVGV